MHYPLWVIVGSPRAFSQLQTRAPHRLTISIERPAPINICIISALLDMVPLDRATLNGCLIRGHIDGSVRASPPCISCSDGGVSGNSLINTRLSVFLQRSHRPLFAGWLRELFLPLLIIS
jgi:hypothetical protein